MIDTKVLFESIDGYLSCFGKDASVVDQHVETLFGGQESNDKNLSMGYERIIILYTHTLVRISGSKRMKIGRAEC